MNLTFLKSFVLIFITTLVLLILGLTELNSVATGQETKRVFVLNSYHRGFTFSDNEMRGIDDAFSKSGIKVETYITYMDMKRIPNNPQYLSQLKELIREGYKGVRFDAILACDNDALNFMRKYRDELFPGVPVVFTAINDFDERMLDGRRDLTGTIENTNYAGTINIALKLRPATKNIVVVTDNTTTGKAHRAAAEKIRHDFPQSLGFTYLSLGDMTLDEISQKLSELKSDSIVLLLHHFVDINGTPYTIEDSTSLLAKSSSVPAFVVNESRMGFGALGGHLVNGYFQGETAAQMVVKILGGTDVRTIPVLLESPNRYMFDYIVMQRFSIAEKDLPQGSLLINKPFSLLDKYRPQLLTILGVFIVLCGLVVYLLVEIRKRKQVEKELRESEDKFRTIFEGAGDGILIADTITKKFLQGNTVICSMLGYTKEEIKNLTIYDIHPTQEIPHVLDEFEKQIQGEIILAENLPVLRKDGSIFYADISSSSTTIGGIHFLVGIFRDITEQKRAEDTLRENDQKLRNLADNLPNAMVYQLTAEPDGGRRFTYVSRAVERLNETTEKEVLVNAGVIYGQVLPEYHSLVREREEEALKNLTTMQVEVQSRLPSGRLRWFEYTSTPHQQSEGLIVWNGVEVDITERKQAEEKIKASLREKDILISEIHHRVKNNLQVMSGLLKLQESASKSPEAIEGFRESRDRIRSMAMVHEKLHNSEDFSKIDLAGYMRSLTQDLFISHKIHSGKIDLTIEIKGDIVLDVSIAIPCALVMNELISNALKHAFPGDRPGKLQIMIRETESKEIEIMVRDNGVGIPYDVDIHEPKSVGLHIVNGLVKNQIDGKIEVRRDNGTEFRITFPL